MKAPSVRQVRNEKFTYCLSLIRAGQRQHVGVWWEVQEATCSHQNHDHKMHVHAQMCVYVHVCECVCAHTQTHTQTHQRQAEGGRGERRWGRAQND